MSTTTIEWTWRHLPDGTMVPGYTFNIVWGCIKVSEACRDCYADAFAHRLGLDLWGPGKPRKTMSTDYWQAPLKWNRDAERTGHRRNIFCSSMGDTFEDHPTVTAERTKLWPLIERTPWLNWLLLTKRPQHILTMAPWGSTSWPDNIWIGTSVETQARAVERIPALLAVPVRVHFLSCEPLLEALDLTPWLPALQWIITGGESGRRARPMDPDWPRDLREQCQRAQIPYYFKQWGGRYHNSGGRLLDGVIHDAMPPEEERVP